MANTEREELNSAQLKAVEITEGPVLVVAGAGTGKTRVIVKHVIRLIEKGADASSILALTFTEKAAGEMADRVADTSLALALDTRIATFNSLGGDLLKQFGNEWGLGALRLLGETGQLVFLREHFDELNLDYFAPINNPDGQLSSLRDFASQLKQQLVTPEAYTEYAGKLPGTTEAELLEKTKHKELAYFYTKYIALCREHQVIDYDDQIYLSLELLRARPNILKKLQEQYKYILVDEFQDTNPMQSALIDLLAGNAKNLMVVGDDDQSIYGWRGATLANILDFKKRYPKAQEVALIENYRSTQPILDAAYRLIQNNNPERLEVISKLDKQLHAQTGGDTPKIRHFYTFESELTWLAEDISKRLDRGQDPAQIAVLARGRQTVDRVHQILEMNGISHAVAGQKNDLYKQTAVQRLIEILKAVANPLDSLALFHTLSGPAFDLPLNELSALSAQSQREHKPLSQMIETSDDRAFKAALNAIKGWNDQSRQLSVGELAYKIITDSGWKQQLYEQTKGEAEAYIQAQALGEYFKTLKEFERVSGLPSLQSYLLNLPALEASGGDFEDSSLQISDSLVNVMTVHSAKGLEWDTVFVVDCLERSFPLAGNNRPSLTVPEELRTVKSAADEHMAEERRLMYVAITRARQELTVSHSDRRGGGAPRKPSRFISEMLVASTDTIEHTDTVNLELFAPNEPSANISLPETILQDGKFVLTASQIECWLNCPQDFYYKHILNMPEPDSPAAAYGTAIHGAIQAIFDGRRAGTVPSLEDITNLVVKMMPQAGYATAGIRERAHARATASIKNIYERFAKEELPTQDEEPFAVLVPDLPVKITGRIDAIYQRETGTEIRDFKTSSSVKTAEKAKQRAASSGQLTVYALAWQIMYGELPQQLTLDFVETGHIGPIHRTQKSIDTLQAKLADLAKQLKTGQYPPGKNHNYCSHPVG